MLNKSAKDFTVKAAQQVHSIHINKVVIMYKVDDKNIYMAGLWKRSITVSAVWLLKMFSDFRR